MKRRGEKKKRKKRKGRRKGEEGRRKEDRKIRKEEVRKKGGEEERRRDGIPAKGGKKKKLSYFPIFLCWNPENDDGDDNDNQDDEEGDDQNHHLSSSSSSSIRASFYLSHSRSHTQTCTPRSSSRILVHLRQQVCLDLGPLLVNHAEPGGVPVDPPHHQMLPEQALKGEPQPQRGRLGRLVPVVALPLHTPRAPALDGELQHRKHSLGVHKGPLVGRAIHHIADLDPPVLVAEIDEAESAGEPACFLHLHSVPGHRKAHWVGVVFLEGGDIREGPAGKVIPNLNRSENQVSCHAEIFDY